MRESQDKETLSIRDRKAKEEFFQYMMDNPSQRFWQCVGNFASKYFGERASFLLIAKGVRSWFEPIPNPPWDTDSLMDLRHIEMDSVIDKHSNGT